MSGPAGLPRLLAEIPAEGAMELTAHLELHGPIGDWASAAARPGRRGGEHPLIGELDRAGLRGRGGGGFPTAAKMRAVVGARGVPVVVVNAAEGEPASRKDRVLTRSLPHLVLDGASAAASAVGADEVLVCVCESARASARSLAGALAQRRPTRSGRSSHGAGRVALRLRAVPDSYIAGQESALVQCLNGGPALPSFTPPMPFERGVAGRPTLVSNAETLAHIALIARHGAEWFRELGPPSQPGSALVTLSGPVPNPGVYEIEPGVSLSALVRAAGGTSGPIAAALIGGYGGSWIAGEQLRGLELSQAALAPLGATLGAGVIALLGTDRCPIAETAGVLRWLAHQSAGQCGPCVHGLAALARTFEELASPTASARQRAEVDGQIVHLAARVRARGACAHPDGAARLAISALDAFGPELAEHARHGRCELCTRPPALPLPGTGGAPASSSQRPREGPRARRAPARPRLAR